MPADDIVILRPKFDLHLVELARTVGVAFRPETTLASLAETDTGIVATLAEGARVEARALIGADGANSFVARMLGIRDEFAPSDVILSANEMVPADPAWIHAAFGPDRACHVWLAFGGISGYAWIFPKHETLAVGMGGRRLQPGQARMLMTRFFDEARSHSLLPPSACSQNLQLFPDPAGLALKCRSLVSRCAVLVGDAGGFVSARSGEGIFPAMLSAKIAAELVSGGLKQGNLADKLQGYDAAWRAELGSYLTPPGPQLLFMLGMLYSDPRITTRLARAFLFGEPI